MDGRSTPEPLRSTLVSMPSPLGAQEASTAGVSLNRTHARPILDSLTLDVLPSKTLQNLTGQVIFP